jgi:hypothetical protein
MMHASKKEIEEELKTARRECREAEELVSS